jgi:hypothetical protein
MCIALACVFTSASSLVSRGEPPPARGSWACPAVPDSTSSAHPCPSRLKVQAPSAGHRCARQKERYRCGGNEMNTLAMGPLRSAGNCLCPTILLGDDITCCQRRVEGSIGGRTPLAASAPVCHSYCLAARVRITSPLQLRWPALERVSALATGVQNTSNESVGIGLCCPSID